MTPRSINLRESRRGFTLLELTVSMTIASILMVSMGSIILLATRAVPDIEGPTSWTLDANDVTGQLNDELQTAVYVVERSDTGITFTVPDRDADGDDERIQYAWAGPGSPLTRAYNGGAAQTVIDDVDTFHLTYDRTIVTEQYPGLGVEDETETLLSARDVGSSFWSSDVTPTGWRGQHIQPSLPADATAWRPTRATIRLEDDGVGTGSIAAEIRTAESFLPTDQVLDTDSLDSSDTSTSWTWLNVSFDDVPPQPTYDALGLVLRYESGDPAISVRSNNDFGSMGRTYTTDAGASWGYLSTVELCHYLYGKVTRPGGTQVAHHQFLDTVGILLAHGVDATIDSRVATLNAPRFVKRSWAIDFKTDDPTTLDVNGDGVMDWKVRSGAPYDAANIVDLDTMPPEPFDTLTIVDVSMRCTDDTSSAVFWINVENDTSIFNPIIVRVYRDDSKQHVSVYTRWPLDAEHEVVDVFGLDTGMQRIRLIIDPDLNTVHVAVGTTDCGTHVYQPYATGFDPQAATLTTWGSGAEFGSVSILVMEDQP